MGNALRCSLLGKDKDNLVRLEAKEEHFIRNGAILLEKQISTFHGKGMSNEPLKIFSERLIRRATNHYDPRLVMGGDIATVYRGTLDGRAVAVKVHHDNDRPGDNDWMTEFFMNQVVVKQAIGHRNAVRLYGCCLESPVPVLVYEFLPNDTLHRHLHDRGGVDWLSWGHRVGIAAGSSHALCYMHCGAGKPVVHLDVKSGNVFLDESFAPKLSNFGFSVQISPGEVYQSREIVGPWGYIDPEYARTGHVTEKCDVYSFGVMLLELLTNVDPASCDLVYHFVSCKMVHNRVREEGAEEEIKAFTRVALRCVADKAEERHSMQEVASELKRIKRLVAARLGDESQGAVQH